MIIDFWKIPFLLAWVNLGNPKLKSNFIIDHLNKPIIDIFRTFISEMNDKLLKTEFQR